jgi:hypothetical protein
MKIRNGFVSNSSSSSFVILGAVIAAKDYNEEIHEKNGIKNIYNDYKDQYYVGKLLAYGDPEDSTFNGNLSLDEINQYIDEISEKINVPKSEIFLKFGSIYQ